MNVLIVEDSGPMRQLIKEIVSQLADEVHECGDGADALAASPTTAGNLLRLDKKFSFVA